IGGDCLANGYLNRPELTDKSFIRNFFSTEFKARLYKTGDLARYLPDGNIEFLGRIDHQVKIRGFRIELGEIESVLSKHEEVKEVVIIAREDQLGNKQLAAYCTSKQEGKAPEPSQLREFLRKKLPDYMIPSAFVILDALPLTPNGKIDRKALPAPDIDLMREHEFTEPKNEMEKIIAEIWKDVLNIEKVSVYDNFFELGGNSLLTVRLASQIEKAVGKDFPIANMFEYSTIEQMSKSLSKDKKASFSPLVRIQAKGEKTPFFCVHPVGGTVFCYTELASSLGTDKPFYALQSSGMNKGEKLFTTIEDMAAYYIKALYTVCKEGPYNIGGWSMGGLIALEMAQQLQETGQATDLLVLIDSYTPAVILEKEPVQKPDQKSNELFMMLQDLEGILGKTIPLDPEKLKGRDKDEQLEYALKSTLEIGVMPPGMDFKQMMRLYKIYKANLEAIRYYKPHHYSGRTVLFSSTEKKQLKIKDATQGWKEFISPHNLDIRQIPGNHYTMLQESNVSVLAEEMNRIL
ncbi:MAG: AMP-binding protein, partial [Desulfobacula sp.]|uniref:thioesterase domain-containing protein n=1 Tax=Desulfobacula sp. TaxID=2593537 RepID=UPI001ECDB358|nr:AMP-binding protein [Desulfobacula sp.]